MQLVNVVGEGFAILYLVTAEWCRKFVPLYGGGALTISPMMPAPCFSDAAHLSSLCSLLSSLHSGILGTNPPVLTHCRLDRACLSPRFSLHSSLEVQSVWALVRRLLLWYFSPTCPVHDLESAIEDVAGVGVFLESAC